MLQKLYFHVYGWIPYETLAFCEIKFSNKKYTHPPKPYGPGFNMWNFPNICIFLCAFLKLFACTVESRKFVVLGIRGSILNYQ